MAKRNIIYHKTIHGKETIIYSIEDEKTGRNKYFILDSVSEQVQDNPKTLKELRDKIERINEDTDQKISLVSRTTENGEKRWFIAKQSSLVEALRRSHQVDSEIKRDENIIKSINKDSKKGVIASGNQYKKPSGKVKAKAVAIGLAVTILVGSIVGLTALGNRDNEGPNNDKYTVSGEVTDINDVETSKPSTSEKNEYIDIDLSTFKYETYLNSAGVRMIKTEDAFKIAETCYNVMSKALKEYNKSVPENKRYSYDPSDFDSSHMMARWTRESSLIIDVDPQNSENVQKADDYEKRCRGPFKMSADAINEANNIAIKIFGDKIIKTEEDLYNPIKQCMASYLFNIQANEYFESYGVNDVSCSQLGASYLYGAWGTVRDKRENSSYAKDIEYYAKCYAEKKDEIINSNMSEKEKNEAVYELNLKLWAKPNWSEVEPEGIEPGE